MADTVPTTSPAGALARVAVVTRAMSPFHGYGGLERHAADLVRHLRARGLEVTVITRPPRKPGTARHAAAGSRAKDNGLEAGVAYEWVPYWTFPGAGRRGTTVADRSTAYLWFGRRAGRRAAELVARGRADVVYGLGASVIGYALARARRTGRPAAPLVFNPQGLEEFGATDPSYAGARLKRLAYLPLQRAVRACARAADRVIATDDALVPVVERHLGVARDRLAVVPNAIDVEECDRLAGPADGRALRQREGIPPDEPVLLSVGRIEANKGFHVLAASLAAIASLRWRWVLVGDGPYRGQLEQVLARHLLEPRARIVGRVDDRALHAWYEAASLFVHPTLYEGSSLVTLEAMAHRKVVVATRAGGLPDKVEHGRTGWLVEPGDGPALSAAIGNALGGLDHLQSMGERGRHVVEQRFTWPVVAGQLLALFEEVTRVAGRARLEPERARSGSPGEQDSSSGRRT